MARVALSRVSADADTASASAAIVAQQRIFQLKKERDKKINDVAAKTIAELDDIKRQVSHEREEHERQRKHKKARILLDISKTKQKRDVIEEEMMAVVLEMHKIMAVVEDAMIQAYDSKEYEVKQVLECDQD